MAWYLVSDFRGYFQLFTVEYDVGCKFVIHGLRHVEVCYLYTHLVEGFIINGYWTLSEAFYASIEMIIIFIFQFVNAVCHIDLFADIETFLHLWDKLYSWFANLFFENLYYVYQSVILFLSSIFVWFWYQGNDTHRSRLEAFLTVQFFGIVWGG